MRDIKYNIWLSAMNDIDNLILLPAILFPAIPLMMVNFGNRYNSLSSLIRKIHDEFINKKIYQKISLQKGISLKSKY